MLIKRLGHVSEPYSFKNVIRLAMRAVLIEEIGMCEVRTLCVREIRQAIHRV